MTMHLGFDMTRVGPHGSGIGIFALTVLRAVHQLLPGHPEWQIFALATPGGREIIQTALIDSAHGNQLHPQLSLCTVPEGKGWLKEQLSLPSALRKLPPLDLLYSPGYPVSPLSPARRTLLQVHDMVPWQRGDTMTPTGRLYWRMMLPPAIRRAAQLLVDSQFTAQELKRYRFAHNKPIRVMHPAVSARYMVTPADKTVSATLRALGISCPYLIASGNLEPRKNLTFLLDTFGRYLEANPHTRVDLVLTGGSGWKNAPFYRKLSTFAFAERVHLLGWLPAEQLVHLMAGAEALLYPSLYEGFGLPPLEAVALGTPALVSDRTSIPEIMGPCGLYGAPDDIGRWVQMIEQVVGNRTYREQLAERGKSCAARYSETALRDELERVLLGLLP
jgi:glycosyltransferase involved in cell wall biosynthesis